jgi:hypothetical protein
MAGWITIPVDAAHPLEANHGLVEAKHGVVEA